MSRRVTQYIVVIICNNKITLYLVSLSIRVDNIMWSFLHFFRSDFLQSLKIRNHAIQHIAEFFKFFLRESRRQCRFHMMHILCCLRIAVDALFCKDNFLKAGILRHRLTRDERLPLKSL